MREENKKVAKNIVSVRFNDYEDKLIRTYAEIEGVTVSELIRSRVLAFVQDKEVNAVFKEAYERHIRNQSELYSYEDAIEQL